MRQRLVGAAAACVIALTGCVQLVAPARSDASFDRKANATAEAVSSAVGVALTVVDAASDGKLLAAYASVALGEAESDAAGARKTFHGIQPPTAASDRTRRDLEAIVDPAVEVLTELRIAARQGRLGDLDEIAEPLRDVPDRIDAFTEAHG